jgi:hypothetical protein
MRPETYGSKGWKTDGEADDCVQVIPIADLKQHVEHGEYCHCVPHVMRDYARPVVVHNAYDGREFAEVAL